jgi:hypothetical protein
MDEVTLPKKTYRFNEEKPLRVRLSEEKNADISAVTATIKIYKSDGTQALADTGMSVGGTAQRPVLSYQLTTGSGKNLTEAGNYRARIRATIGTVIREWQVPVEVLADPS